MESFAQNRRSHRGIDRCRVQDNSHNLTHDLILSCWDNSLHKNWKEIHLTSFFLMGNEWICLRHSSFCYKDWILNKRNIWKITNFPEPSRSLSRIHTFSVWCVGIVYDIIESNKQASELKQNLLIKNREQISENFLKRALLW